jgi:hypothetical protein
MCMIESVEWMRYCVSLMCMTVYMYNYVYMFNFLV